MAPPVPKLAGWEQFALSAAPYVAEAAFAAALLFIVAYTILTRWYTSSIGITIVLLDLMICVTLLPGVLQYVFHVSVTGSEFWTFLSLGAVAAVPLIIMWRLVILLQVQLRHRERSADA